MAIPRLSLLLVLLQSRFSSLYSISLPPLFGFPLVPLFRLFCHRSFALSLLFALLLSSAASLKSASQPPSCERPILH